MWVLMRECEGVSGEGTKRECEGVSGEGACERV